jgi:TRAP-type C4-dicarboxylate transport system permease small subunit
VCLYNNFALSNYIGVDEIMNLTKKKKRVITKLSTIGTTLTLFAIQSNICFAESGIGTAEVQTATDNIKRVITSIAMPLGGVLIFASVVVAAIKMIANANNPQKRAESIGSLAWICGGGVILGASLIIAGIIINVATNNTGSLLGS